MVTRKKAYLLSVMVCTKFFVLEAVENQRSNSLQDFPIPPVWTITNKTEVPLTYTVTLKNRDTELFRYEPKEAQEKSETIKPGETKAYRHETNTMINLVLVPSVLEVSSDKNKAIWQPSANEFYDVIVTKRNGSLEIQATPWAASRKQEYAKTWLDSHPGHIEHYKNHIAPKIQERESRKKQQSLIINK